MFILYAVIIGILAGVVVGGLPLRLGYLTFRFGWLVLTGLVVQIALFSSPLTASIGELGPLLYVVSTAAVLVAVATNWRVTGVPLVVAGAACNLAAIAANGGYMPADPGALAAVGYSLGAAYSNSTVLADPALGILTDIFALPRWLPFTNVFSIGDVIIGLGVARVIVAAMRNRALDAGLAAAGARTSTPATGSADDGRPAGRPDDGGRGTHPVTMGGGVSEDQLEAAISELLERSWACNRSPGSRGPVLSLTPAGSPCAQTTGPPADIRWYRWVIEDA